jgi:hypothetical protein
MSSGRQAQQVQHAEAASGCQPAEVCALEVVVALPHLGAMQLLLLAHFRCGVLRRGGGYLFVRAA